MVMKSAIFIWHVKLNTTCGDAGKKSNEVLFPQERMRYLKKNKQ